MRVSAGCFVTALSGNTRSQSLPPFFMWRPMATRPASSWRAVTHFGSSALRAYSPNEIVVPRLAGPLMRGWLCGLRYLTRLGISIGSLLRGGGGSLSSLGGRFGRSDDRRRRFFLSELQKLLGALDEQLLLENPDLDADEAGHRERFGRSVVDVGAVRVQRH